MTTYLFVTDPAQHKPGNIRYDDDAWWSCSKTALAGDQALVYLVGGVGIKYEWQITSQAEPDDEWGSRCGFVYLRTFRPPITLAEICSVVRREIWAPPHLNFRGYRSIRIPDDAVVLLRSLRKSSAPSRLGADRDSVQRAPKRYTDRAKSFRKR